VNQRAASPRPGASAYRIPVLLLLSLITYGSLYPFAWNFTAPQAFDYALTGRPGLSDLVENIILFLPLGWILAWRHQALQCRRVAAVGWLMLALVFAFVLQWLQMYLPRTPALADVLFNLVGYLAGWAAGLATRHALTRLTSRQHRLRDTDRFALLMVVLWLIAELFPLIPTTDLSTVIANLKSLWQLPAWQPRRLALHAGMTVIGLEALAHLLRSMGTAHPVRWLTALAATAVLAGKFLVVGQSPGLAVVFGIGIGTATWLLIDHAREAQRLALVMAAATALYLLHALWPWQWRDTSTAFSWLPFASSLNNSIESVIRTTAFECLCFGAILWAATRSGALLGGTTALVAVLAFGCEWAQRYLPGRTPEITALLLAVGMGWLVAALRHSKLRPRFEHHTQANLAPWG